MMANLYSSQNGSILLSKQSPQDAYQSPEENCQWWALQSCYIEGVGYSPPQRGTGLRISDRLMG